MRCGARQTIVEIIETGVSPRDQPFGDSGAGFRKLAHLSFDHVRQPTLGVPDIDDCVGTIVHDRLLANSQTSRAVHYARAALRGEQLHRAEYALRAEDIARAAWRLIVDADQRRDMRAASLNTIDGKAGERIAQDLAEALAGARAQRREAAKG